MNNSKGVKPFGFKDKLGYLLGDLGNDFSFLFSSSFLMLFYTKVWGIPASIVGILFLVSRFLDAFTDIGMGTIIDKSTPTKDGKFRPWIKRVALPISLMTFLMFQSGLSGASMTVKIIVMFVTYILWGSFCYTAINIPYGSMASAITDVPEERAVLSTWRSMGANIASVIVNSLVPLFIYYSDASGNKLVSGTNFTIIAGIFSLCSFLCYIGCFKLTTERVKFEKKDNNEKKEKVSFFKNFGLILKNRALLAMIACSIVLLLSQLTVGTMNQYLFADYFKNIGALSVYSAAALPISLVLVTFLAKLSGKVGKKEIGTISMIFTGALYCLVFVLRVRNPWVYVSITVLATVGISAFNMLIWANITDIIDYQEVLTGKRDDATIYGVYSFSRKIGQALAGGLGGFILTFIGYNSATSTQTVAVTESIYTVSTILPGICYIGIGLILAFAYPLSRKVVEENSTKLAKIHKSKAV
ncbi:MULTISPECIES: MFS transporter [Romboutsia]|uniref:MFS transporter n=1 Tax=Romboutsia TaxID=1501226 RepID=UPI00216D524B|nr:MULTISPECIES: glycoside-pentoside-hexuronide (GPH):cation symporter [Romboutsia]MCI9259735.1 MFS transporter [Romboutsia sp.]